ncbi:ethanolamine utilization microcompartment protein EutL [Pontibacillus yanchengensis]|uniref:Ethanolamine utilization microcompartment protein EutL n=2 Tax=Pontibacillus yanchengensis TaxID=462910 RepID=A0ACC7VM98_9BACI|nr:ethanolamine utilization microcompartment protein EutL [Pontibacillus yanchengensis]MYL35763.1 ethanolamine utilization microcompartment protein EutL [Pontibacillus yanchengensis]MYL55474.1 ethanolamine utilization microcompartment protein EutL [Pontibacillus yanchengensis]
MNTSKVYADLLSIRIISSVEQSLADSLNLNDNQKSLALFTVNIDDVGVTALDEATKRAEVDAVMANSFYAGADHASGPLSGEFIGILAGPNPDEVKSGIDVVQQVVSSEAFFEAVDEREEHCFYAHVISSSGTFLSKEAGVKEGESLAYLIAPPLEATYGIDSALKASDVQLASFYEPPSETNFGGGLLSGSQAACEAAADAFREAVVDIANHPMKY